MSGAPTALLAPPALVRRVALCLALAAGAAGAQTAATGTGPQSGASTGSSVTGGGAAPMAQPGQGTRNSPTGKTERIGRGDRKIIEEAANSGMYEVQMSQLAATRARSEAVRQFAGMLVAHHAQANDELIRLANARGVELPPAPKRALRNEIEQLAGKTGDDFDRDYVGATGVREHKRAVAMLRKASRDAKDPALREWIARALPVMEQHLAQAQALHGQLSAPRNR